MTAPCRSLAPLSPGWSKRQKDLPSALWGPGQVPLPQFPCCAMERTITHTPTLPWEKVAGAVAGSGQAGHKVPAELGGRSGWALG